MATLPLKPSRNEQRAVFHFLWQKDLPVTKAPLKSGLSPSDYHLIGPMKKMLDEQKFASDTKVQSVVRQWLGQQPASFLHRTYLNQAVIKCGVQYAGKVSRAKVPEFQCRAKVWDRISHPLQTTTGTHSKIVSSHTH